MESQVDLDIHLDTHDLFDHLNKEDTPLEEEQDSSGEEDVEWDYDVEMKEEDLKAASKDKGKGRMVELSCADCGIVLRSEPHRELHAAQHQLPGDDIDDLPSFLPSNAHIGETSLVPDSASESDSDSEFEMWWDDDSTDGDDDSEDDDDDDAPARVAPKPTRETSLPERCSVILTSSDGSRSSSRPPEGSEGDSRSSLPRNLLGVERSGEFGEVLCS
jgi:hypothetical protein